MYPARGRGGPRGFG